MIESSFNQNTSELDLGIDFDELTLLDDFDIPEDFQLTIPELRANEMDPHQALNEEQDSSAETIEIRT